MKIQLKILFLVFGCFFLEKSVAQSAFEIAIATDYQNVINKAQNTYMRPKDGAANQKIHQWETSAQAAGDF
ncbi:MAG: hypothetical protein RIC03_17400, partial [Cyclobacteriaceae bacterium]